MSLTLYALATCMFFADAPDLNHCSQIGPARSTAELCAADLDRHQAETLSPDRASAPGEHIRWTIRTGCVSIGTPVF